jgi:hypothetical protein
MVRCSIHGSDHEPYQCPGVTAQEKRALELQARGPDEFPFGYYMYLAELEFKEKREHAKFSR